MELLRPLSWRRKRSLKRKSELTISRQAFSFVFSKTQSFRLVTKFLKLHTKNFEKVTDLYYKYARVLKRYCSHPINKNVLSAVSHDSDCDLLQGVMCDPAYSEELNI